MLALNRWQELGTLLDSKGGAESLPDDQHPADFAGWVTTGKTQYDGFGNVVFRRGPNHRCASVEYDGAYHQLAETETVYAGLAGPNPEDCGTKQLEASATYDRGLQAPLTVTDVTGATTTATYDSLGRIYQIFAPRPDRDNVDLPPAATKVQYILPDDNGSPPYSRLVTMSQDGSDEGAGDYHVAHAFIDGLGRTIAALTEADPDVDGYPWIVGGLTDYDKKGAERRKYLPWSWDGADPSQYPLSVEPTTPYGQQRYDAFGRAIQTIGLDGTITLETHYHALSADAWDAEDLGPGEHQGTFASEQKDGHGRVTQTTERVRVNGKIEARFVRPAYLPSGEVTSITRSAPGKAAVSRTMQYDSVGRMTVNDDPNTSRTVDSVRKTWRYAYNDAGELIGTSDARGCGVNFAYDAAGRLVTEDYAPCEAHHAAYTKYVPEVGYWYDADDLEDAGEFTNPDCHSGGKNSVQGRLVSVTDRSGKSMTCYDQRGRTIEVARQLADPFGNRAGRWYNRQAQYDAADRSVMETTGASVPPGVTSYVATSYTQRGTVNTVTSPYGTLVEGIKREPDGMVTEIKYGDGAHTTTSLTYDDLRRLHNQTTYRASFGPSGTLTTQMLLQDEEFVYDRVGNPVEIRDWRIADEWPTGAKPVTRKMRYDDLYRLVRMGYEYEEGADTWTDPYAAEQEAASLPDNTRDRPMPRADFGAGHRVLEQSWQYDWLCNTEKTDDDQHAFWDRSLGTVGNGTPEEGAYKLKSAGNTAAPGDHTGSLTTDYDEAGDLINLTVDRAGTCVGGNPCGVMHFAYDWDEVGRLVRARRWDAPNLQSIPPPDSVAQATLDYVYDSSDQRTRKTAVDGAGHQLHSLYVFGSLELRHAAFDGTDYELTASTETPYLQAHGVRLARVVHQTPPDEYSTESSTRVFLELGDQLGSTSVVLDLASGELVERSTAYAYGAAESDYRPDRWGKFREDYRFTGKEEDIEVGLQYFGKRFYAPLLQRWVSADPLAVHPPGQADLNLYAYVHGRVLVAVDPVGLKDDTALPASWDPNQDAGLAGQPHTQSRLTGCTKMAPRPAPIGPAIEHGVGMAVTEIASNAVSPVTNIVDGARAADKDGGLSLGKGVGIYLLLGTPAGWAAMGVYGLYAGSRDATSAGIAAYDNRNDPTAASYHLTIAAANGAGVLGSAIPAISEAKSVQLPASLRIPVLVPGVDGGGIIWFRAGRGNAMVPRPPITAEANSLPAGAEPYQLGLFPDQAYNRLRDCGRTPTAAQRASVPSGMEFDHDPALVHHYYWGDGNGGLPGFNQLPQERSGYGSSLGSGQGAAPLAQRQQGGLAAFSRLMKRVFGLR